MMRLVRRASLLVVFYVLAGCGMPTIGHKLPTTPEAKPADATACEQAAPPNIEDRDARYAGCMLARDYRVVIGLGKEALYGKEHAGIPYVNVGVTRRHDATEATEDLVSCRRAALAAVGGVIIWSPTDVPAMEKAFQECAGPRGYTSSRWSP